ncbi:NAD(P)H-dependent flavin oxidoreductase [Actinomadura rupiterrae]|uniref:NAD(P)H-dependent flavin oxidoreductase n=1 Tax=Actinomadura rupiterrae TaxID=559627 RepID=UPI0020A39A0C|nr:nitronate monooxygenase [Actinomadura rupiterrae]MCP2338687.1 nitronate monooxygenase [Actinomadura rupiterrae]
MTDRQGFAELAGALRIPVMAAPMFLVSGTEMVTAAARAGIIGAFPAANARTVDDLGVMIDGITAGAGGGAWGVNLIVHRTYDRLDTELALLREAAPALVITALGSPRRALDAVHGWGGLVFADISTPEQARRAIDAGADGLSAVCAGAGGHTGRYSPFALVTAIREFWDGPLIAGGAVCSGAGVLAMRVLGADVVNVGTRLLATAESRADEGHRQMVIEAEISDITTSDTVTGVPANWLSESLRRHTAAAGSGGAAGIDFSGAIAESKAWRDVWSAGEGVGAVRRPETMAEAIASLGAEYDAALALLRAVPHAEPERRAAMRLLDRPSLPTVPSDRP